MNYEWGEISTYQLKLKKEDLDLLTSVQGSMRMDEWAEMRVENQDVANQ